PGGMPDLMDPGARVSDRLSPLRSASLFGQPRSSAFGPSCVVTWTYPSGFSLLSGIGPIGPSMMGSEERSGTIFKASFVLTKLKEQHMHRTHFVPRPARDNSPPQREPQTSPPGPLLYYGTVRVKSIALPLSSGNPCRSPRCDAR